MHTGRVFSVKAQSFPVYGRGGRLRGTLSSSSPAISPGLPAQFSRAFLSFGFHGDLGRQEIRQSFRQLCEGKQEAGRREAGQHRPAPPRPALRPPIPPCPKGTRVRGRPGRSPRRCGRENPGPRLWSKKMLLWPQAAHCHGTTSKDPSTARSARQALSGTPAPTPTPGRHPRPAPSRAQCIACLSWGKDTSYNPLGYDNSRGRTAQGDVSRLCSEGTECCLSPPHRGPTAQEPLGPDPAPGVPASADAAGGPSAGPAPGSAAESPALSPPEQALPDMTPGTHSY